MRREYIEREMKCFLEYPVSPFVKRGYVLKKEENRFSAESLFLTEANKFSVHAHLFCLTHQKRLFLFINIKTKKSAYPQIVS